MGMSYAVVTGEVNMFGWYPVLQAVKQHCGVEALNGDGKAMIVERGGM